MTIHLIHLPESYRKVVFKGVNYTKQITRTKEGEVVQEWTRIVSRPLSKCGVWVDGKLFFRSDSEH